MSLMRLAGLVALWFPTACSPSSSAYPLDGVLSLVDVQAKGTHNSYHVEPVDPVDPSHRYTHAPLAAQLDELGVRQFELDLHLRSGGGFEVFHLPADVDPETTCRRFTDCLGQIKAWSDVHPAHMPLLFWLEPKDEDLDWADPTLEPIVGHYAELEAEILSVWPQERILMPDEVRGSHPTLADAVTTQGWPVLGELRGRVIFAMLDSGTHRDAYTADAPDLRGRLMFVNASDPTEPFAAMFKVNNAMAQAERVGELVRAGFVVTSNVDGVETTDVENRDRADASLAAGAHFLSTDFPAPVEGRDYVFDIPGGLPARCNPLTQAACSAPDIESLD